MKGTVQMAEWDRGYGGTQMEMGDAQTWDGARYAGVHERIPPLPRNIPLHPAVLPLPVGT